MTFCFAVKNVQRTCMNFEYFSSLDTGLCFGMISSKNSSDFETELKKFKKHLKSTFHEVYPNNSDIILHLKHL